MTLVAGGRGMWIVREGKEVGDGEPILYITYIFATMVV
jgi:hypothetical protein